MVTDLDTYLFDLLGYLFLPGALTPDEVADLNACLDDIPSLEPGEWYGYIHAHQYGTSDGLNLQQIYEAGAPFENLICLLYTSPSPRDGLLSRMPSSA